MCNLEQTRSGEMILGINFSLDVGNIDLSCLDMRSVAGEKVVLLNGVFLYSNKPISRSVLADFALVNMLLHILTYASEKTVSRTVMWR